MKCDKCGRKLLSITTIDNHWKVFKKCKCGHEQFGLVGRRIT